MNTRWNFTYLMLKHLIPYKNIFSVFTNSHYGEELLTKNYWHVVEKIMQFLELFYDSIIVVSGAYYPTSPLVLHHILEIASHLHDAERDQNLFQHHANEKQSLRYGFIAPAQLLLVGMC